MNVEIRPFDEGSLVDAQKLVESGFGPSAVPILHKILANPLRGDGESAGDIVYEDNMPVAFQAAMKRRYFIGAKSFFATLPCMLVALPGHSPANLLSLVECSISERFDRKMVLGNTAMPVSRKLHNLLGITGKGPSTCERVQFGVLRIGSFLRFCSHCRLPKFLAGFMDVPSRVKSYWGRQANIELWNEIRVADINGFWARYLKTNSGLVASRTADELRWLFGREMARGTALMGVGRNAVGEVMGYVVVKESGAYPGRWMVVDWIAVDNDKEVLYRLLYDITNTIVKLRPNAFLLESIGFPEDVKSVVKSCLRFSRQIKNNVFAYQAYGTLDVTRSINDGWFFGPIDGDRCIG